MIRIAVLNDSTVVKDADLQAVIPALQTQVHNHFAPVWGIDAELQFVSGTPPPGAWWLVILDDADQANALGYHDVTDEALPIGKVFVRTTQEAHANWTVTASHELLEMLADPEINLAAIREEQDGAATALYSYEICDPCEADQFGYAIGNVTVSDFVYPSWFESFHISHGTQFDYCGRITAPFALLPGGYMTSMDLAHAGSWTQTNARTSAMARSSSRPAVPGTRRERRKRGRSGWKPSELHGRHARPPKAAEAVAVAAHRRFAAAMAIAAPIEPPKQPAVAEQINNAVTKLQQYPASKPALPNKDAMLATLAKAAQQASTKGRDADLQGAIPDDLHLSLVLSAMAGSAAGPGPIRTMDLVGASQFEELDPGWLKSLFNRLVSDPIRFPTHVARNINPVVTIANQVGIALAGDWGTGDASSRNIAQRIADLAPDHTIHLGDVYYSGTHEEELGKFVGLFPPGKNQQAPSFALNGNHEMYSGAQSYFLDVLGNSQFRGQQGLSYFALTNDHWTIIGLDSAYHARDFLYQNGVLDDEVQLKWLREVGAAARAAGKRIIVLTHHQPIDLDLDNQATKLLSPLWDQVTTALDGGPDYWYWGHVHAGIAYEPALSPQGTSVLGRCVGHGGVPYAPFPPVDQLNNGPVKVAWVETEKANDPNEERRALNGFVLLTLDGAQITEEFRDENGNLRFKP